MNFSDYCTVNMGQAPSGEFYNDCGKGLPLLAGAGDLGDIIPKPSRYSMSFPKKSSRGDIILCIRATIGKKNWSDRDYCLGRGVAAIAPKDKNKTYANYIWHWLSANEQNLISKGKGATFLQVSKQDIETLPCYFPPPAEQRRIAAILDKADAIRRKRQQSLELADSLLKSVFLDMFGDPVTNPKGWGVTELTDIADIASGVTKGRKLEGQQTFDTPYMRVANVKDGYIDLSEIKSIPATQRDIEMYSLQYGDVLLTEGGDSDKLGRGALWTHNIPRCIHQNHIFRVRIYTQKSDAVFFAEYLRHKKAKLYFLGCAKQTTGIASINMRQLRALPVLLPPLSLLKKFNKACKAVEEMTISQKKYFSEADHAFKSLQQSFFG